MRLLVLDVKRDKPVAASRGGEKSRERRKGYAARAAWRKALQDNGSVLPVSRLVKNAERRHVFNPNRRVAVQLKGIPIKLVHQNEIV